MKLKLRLTALTRRCKCHTPGCRNRNAFKITRRNDVNGNPLFLCADCIKDVYAALAEHEAAETAKKQVIDAQIAAQTKDQIVAKETEEASAEEALVEIKEPAETEVSEETEETNAPTETEVPEETEADVEPAAEAGVNSEAKKPAKPRSSRGKA